MAQGLFELIALGLEGVFVLGAEGFDLLLKLGPLLRGAGASRVQVALGRAGLFGQRERGLLAGGVCGLKLRAEQGRLGLGGLGPRPQLHEGLDGARFFVDALAKRSVLCRVFGLPRGMHAGGRIFDGPRGRSVGGLGAAARVQRRRFLAERRGGVVNGVFE